jgi:hypothetical protein
MPAYEYSGPGSRVYPESRDASGRNLGTVDPGDRRFFDDGPPDHLWAEVTGDPPADDEDANPEDEAGTAEGGALVPQPGQPVPPAVIQQ